MRDRGKSSSGDCGRQQQNSSPLINTISPPRYSLISPRRIVEFDGIRGLLSVLVLFGHIANSQTNDHPFAWYVGSMEVFFCLSGFLITYVVLGKYKAAGRFDYRTYFVNRALRIWPAYFVAYITTILISLPGKSYVLGEWRVNEEPTSFGLLAPFFFVQNVEMALGHERTAYVHLFNHSWSVAIEEQFYLITPFLILLLLKCSRAFVICVLGALVALTLTLRAAWMSNWVIVARLDPFVLGAVLYLVYASVRGSADEVLHRRSARVMAITGSSAALLLMPFVMSTYTSLPLQETYGRVLSKTLLEPSLLFSVLGSALLGFVLFGTQQNVVHRFFRLKVLQSLGQISYSLYLFHVPVVYYLCPLIATTFDCGSFFTIAISAPTAIAVAFGCHRFIEQPFLHMRKKTTSVSAGQTLGEVGSA